MNFCFGDIVVVETNLIGVIVKSFVRNNDCIVHEVYVRDYNKIVEYYEKDIQRYMVRHKELDENELEYQFNATNPYVKQGELNAFRKIIMGEKFTDEPMWYRQTYVKLCNEFVGKYVYNEEDSVAEKIVDVYVDRDKNNQGMNRVVGESGNVYFINDLPIILKKE